MMNEDCVMVKDEYGSMKFQAKQDLIFFADRCSIVEYISYLLAKEEGRCENTGEYYKLGF